MLWIKEHTNFTFIYVRFIFCLVTSSNWMSEIRTNQTKKCSDFETEQILQPNDLSNVQNLNIWISDVHCIAVCWLHCNYWPRNLEVKKAFKQGVAMNCAAINFSWSPPSQKKCFLLGWLSTPDVSAPESSNSATCWTG